MVFLCSWSSLMVYLATSNCLWVVYSCSCRFIKSSQVFIHGSNCWIESMFRFALDGHFHADPHPGNLLVEKGTERRRALCFSLVGMHQIVLHTFVYIGCGPPPSSGNEGFYGSPSKDVIILMVTVAGRWGQTQCIHTCFDDSQIRGDKYG